LAKFFTWGREREDEKEKKENEKIPLDHKNVSQGKKCY